MRKFIFLSSLMLSACASVSFHQLDPTTLQVKAGTQEGHVYYLPRPYLWVARLPEAGAQAAALPQAANIPAPQAVAGAHRHSGGDAGDPRNRLPLHYAEVPIARGGADAPSANSAPSLGASDQSFGMIVGNYVIKLVYMPDYSRPMSMSVRSGLFGVGSLEPTLQNGWMLTNFKSSVDNSGFADVLTAVAGIMNTGLVGGLGGSDSGSGGGDASRAASATANREVLRPGLYDFDFDPQTGRLVRLCAINYFTADGMVRGNCGR